MMVEGRAAFRDGTASAARNVLRSMNVILYSGRMRHTNYPLKRIAAYAIVGVSLIGAAYAVQRPFRQYQGWEYYHFPLPPDFASPSEWVFARLMYPSVRFSDRPYTDWRHGAANWPMDYPRSARHP